MATALNAQAKPEARFHFVPQSSLPTGTAYECFVFERRAVPTCNNLHDFFNGLVWLRLLQTKAWLNAIQPAEIARDGVGARRAAARDAATLFDESALLLHVPDAL